MNIKPLNIYINIKMRIISFDIGIRNLAYCILNITPTVIDEKVNKVNAWENVTIEFWECVDVLADCGSKAADCKNVSIDKIAEHVTNTLHRRADKFFKEPVDYIIIERQMRKAPRNMMTSMAVMCYFLNANNLQASPLAIPRPVLVSAAVKLCVNIESSSFASKTKVRHFSNDKKLTSSQNKTRRKNKAIELCKTVLELSPHLQAWKPFLAAGKKDDKADCFLQGLYYLQDKMLKELTKLTKKKEPKVKATNKRKRKRKQDIESEDEEQEEYEME